MCNTPILKFGQSNKTNLLLQIENIKKDLLAPLTCKQDEIEINALETDIAIKELKKEIRTNLEL